MFIVFIILTVRNRLHCYPATRRSWRTFVVMMTALAWYFAICVQNQHVIRTLIFDKRVGFLHAIRFHAWQQCVLPHWFEDRRSRRFALCHWRVFSPLGLDYLQILDEWLLFTLQEAVETCFCLNVVARPLFCSVRSGRKVAGWWVEICGRIHFMFLWRSVAWCHLWWSLLRFAP